MLACVFAAGLLGACDEAPPSYRYGDDLSGVQLDLIDLDMGIHPNRSVLNTAENPFRDAPLQGDLKWQLLDAGGDVAAFYAWATMLTREPIGENQYYTALKLEDLATSGEVQPALEPFLRDMAIRAYQNVLDAFPESVSFDTTGTFAFGLATPAYEGVVRLGGVVTGGWVLIATPDGGTLAIKELDL